MKLTHLITMFLMIAYAGHAQVLPLDKDWTFYYAYSTSKIATSSSNAGFSYEIPLSSSKSSPSKPYLVGEWAGYLIYSQPSGKKGIEAFDLTGSIVMSGIIATSSPGVVFNYDSEPFNTCVSPATLRPFFAGIGSTGESNDRWWSSNAVPLEAGTFSLSVQMDPAYWSNATGQIATYDTATGVNVSGGTATVTFSGFAVNQ